MSSCCKVNNCKNTIPVTTLKNIKEGQEYACYSDIAPLEHSAGSSVGARSRVSHRANKGGKAIFHLAAINAIRMAGDLQTYFERKVGAVTTSCW